jgi:hypothetical protein
VLRVYTGNAYGYRVYTFCAHRVWLESMQTIDIEFEYRWLISQSCSCFIRWSSWLAHRSVKRGNKVNWASIEIRNRTWPCLRALKHQFKPVLHKMAHAGAKDWGEWHFLRDLPMCMNIDRGEPKVSTRWKQIYWLVASAKDWTAKGVVPMAQNLYRLNRCGNCRM